jgi:hypothetical protein
VPSLLGPLERIPNRGGVSLPSHEDGKTPSFYNVVFSSYSEVRRADHATPLYLQNVDTNFADKRRSLGRKSLLAD